MQNDQSEVHDRHHPALPSHLCPDQKSGPLGHYLPSVLCRAVPDSSKARRARRQAQKKKAVKLQNTLKLIDWKHFKSI